MFKSFSGGFASEASLCGGLGVAATFIGAVLTPDEARPVIKEMFDWYRAAELPMYDSGNRTIETTTVAGSTLCYDSVSKYIKKENLAYGDPDRKERCASVSADIAKYVAEVLNKKLG